ASLLEQAASAMTAAIARVRSPARRSADRVRSIRKGVLSTKWKLSGRRKWRPNDTWDGRGGRTASERSAGRFAVAALGGLDSDRQLAGVVREVAPPALD